MRKSEAPDEAARIAASGAVVHKGRKAKPRPAWRASDLAVALGLAGLVLPAWLLPERSWAPLWRGLAWAFADRRANRRRARDIAAALGVSTDAARRIARDLKAAVYEMQMQDLRAWRPGGWRPRIAVEGAPHLEAALAAGKGVLLWIAPFVFYSGVAKIGLDRLGHRASHLSSPVHGFSDTRFGVAVLNRIRCIPEDRHIKERIVFDRNAPSTAMRRMLRALKSGGIVSIVAATTEGFEMAEAPLLGGCVPVALGAPRLAGLSGAPLLPMVVVRERDHGYRIAIGAPLEMDSRQTADQRSVAAAAAYFRRLEPWVREYPEQWRGWSKWRPR